MVVLNDGADRELLVYQTSVGFAFHLYWRNQRCGLLTSTLEACKRLVNGESRPLQSSNLNIQLDQATHDVVLQGTRGGTWNIPAKSFMQALDSAAN